ncbi:MAG TPA: TetR/AcrR family transcriptional regulator [Solimonas sp.]|nr:TetR/AcrR family transcriptional regulator [Solimonas sp.]
MSRTPARKPAPRRAREQRVDQILEAARQVFCEKGYDHAAVAEIAARTGVAEPTVFKYFPTKRELLLSVLGHWYEEMFGDYARDLAGVAGARERLRLLVWRHLRSIREYPQLCHLMFREVRAGSDYRGSAVHAMNRRYTRLLMDTVQAGVASGEFRGDVPVVLLRDLVYGGIEHYAWHYLSRGKALDIDKTAQQIVGVLCDGIVSGRDSGFGEAQQPFANREFSIRSAGGSAMNSLGRS